MRKLTISIILIIIALIVSKAVINKYYFEEFFSPSFNYEQAINNNVILAEYQVEETPDRVIDSLKKYKYYQKILDHKYWVEKQSREVPKYLFFKERLLSMENYIRYDDLVFSSCEEWRRWLSDTATVPIIILSLEDSSSIDKVSRQERYYKSLHSELVPYQITMHVFFKRPEDNSHQSYEKNISGRNHKTEYIGEIVLTESKTYLNKKDKFHSIWKSFNLIPYKKRKHRPCYLGDIARGRN